MRAVGLLIVLALTGPVNGSVWAESTYAERLGWPPGSRVVIFHVDDVGMSHDSNMGAIDAIEKGVATSMSVMFPCAWVSEFAKYVRKHPEIDVGVHLTLTSEWDSYRWGPVAGKKAVPGLVDAQGCLWHGGEDVVKHGTADEVETELRAQVDRCVTMGIRPTHLDTHMGVVFDKPEYAERYLKLGIEKKIPILMAGGHMQCILQENAEAAELVRGMARRVWDAGLPVLDDIHTGSYGWQDPAEKKSKLIQFLKTMKPGVTQIIVHCTKPSEVFQYISGSGPNREADLKLMMDPELRQVIEQEKIILTTWRELKQRRDAVAQAGTGGTPAQVPAAKP
jgi:hypothetical protein